jgi:hypothetical protein
MAAPSATARGTPTGIMLTDPHPTHITLGRHPTIAFKEKEIQPFGDDGGDPIDCTTFFNNRRRSYAPRQLISGTEATVTAAYDPSVLGVLRASINVPDTVTITHPDGSTEARFAFVQKVTPSSNTSDGDQPTIEVVLFPMDQDDDGNEQEPVLVNVAGT